MAADQIDNEDSILTKLSIIMMILKLKLRCDVV